MVPSARSGGELVGSVMPRTLGSGRHRRRPPAVPSFLGTPRDPLSPTWGTRTPGPSGRSNGRRGLRGCPAWAPGGRSPPRGDPDVRTIARRARAEAEQAERASADAIRQAVAELPASLSVRDV